MVRARLLMRVCAALLACATPAPVSGQPINATPASPRPAAQPRVEERVEVVAVTPVQGLGVPAALVPVNVDHIDPRIERGGSLQLIEVLNARNASLNISDTQGSAFQPDLQFRGFTGSALLGAAQGLAVYQDGMRLNEPFGDTVQWSLVLPPNAVRALDVVPGANPMFGLNALGGAISIQTRNGFSDRGASARLSAGSFGRRWAEADFGRAWETASLFVATHIVEEDGWRDFSRSRLAQVFANAGWRSESGTTFDLSFAGSSNRLRGNGATPVQLLEESHSAVFTHPDSTRIDHLAINARYRRSFGPRAVLDALVFARPATFETFNGDDTHYDACTSTIGLLCIDDDPVLPVGGGVVAAPSVPFSATNNRTRTRTWGAGGNAQLSFVHDAGDRVRRAIVGASIDGGDTSFTSSTELARLTPSRGTIGSGIFDAGSLVDLDSTAVHRSLYAAAFHSVTPRLTLNGSARFVSSRITLRDRIGTDLNGDHAFTSVNPSAGFTFAAGRGIGAYANVSISSRVPTPSELSCADPEDPCRLPNAFASDPPLEQVRALAVEGGLRGRHAGVRWLASGFSITNHDDLLFVSSGALANEGYFANVGDTRRAGLELRVSGEAREFAWSAAYTGLRATFEAPFTIASANHPDAMDDEVHVPAGSRLPGVPAHTLKIDLSREFGRLSLGAALRAHSSMAYRGDEANLLEPVDGYAVTDLRARFRVSPRVAIAAQALNLFDRRYSVFGVLGEADDVLGDEYDDPRFVTPGAPRAMWIGVEVTLR